MFKSLLEFIKGLFARHPGAIVPHPHLESDQGEREFNNHLMNAETRHVGGTRRVYN